MPRACEFLVFALVLMALASCGRPVSSLPSTTPSPFATGLVASVTPVADASTATRAPNPTETPAASSAPCAYSWAYQDAPDVPERARTALAAAGLAPSAVSAQTYGENCVNADGTVRQFLPMGTTITAELPVPDLADTTALGDLVGSVVTALAGIGETPGPEPEARLIFSAGGETRALTFKLNNARRLIEAGHGGADLLALLGYQP